MPRKSKTNLNDRRSDPPRWTYTVGALAAVGALVWAIISFFIAKSDPPPPSPPVAVTAPTPAPSVTVSGRGNVGIGTMTGGHIEAGTPTASPPVVGSPAHD
jgi:hypothetical protein